MTGPRCWRCHQSRCTWGGANGSVWAVTTTSVSPPATTVLDPTAIGRIVDVIADLDRVQVWLDGRIVADHARVWARGSTITDPVHVAIAKRLRAQFQQP
jgi:hypothetical protein